MKVVKKIKPIVIGISGAFIGLANLVPGISGGTVAIIFGIYDELIAAFKGIVSRDNNWRQYPDFLLPFLTGLLAALFLFARSIEQIMESHPTQMKMFFIGLILGAVPFLYQKMDIKKLHISSVVLTLAFFFIPILLLIFQPDERELITSPVISEFPLIFFTGFISTATMIIPGISGTMVLMVIGMYPTYIAALSNLHGVVLLLLAIGKVLGVLLVSRLINYLLREFFRSTYLAIIGLLLGSIVNIWPGVSTEPIILLDISILLTGFALAYFLQSKPLQQVTDKF